MGLLTGKKILLGVCGSIAAYKAADLVRELDRQGAQVSVVMTEAASRFVTPLTFAALSGRAVHGDMFAQSSAEEIPHINLARQHDAILIAPATAQTMARLAHGLAEDLLSTVVLAARCPLLICPAMNSQMYHHPATEANRQRLTEYGYQFVAPEAGAMACGEVGDGRLAPLDHIVQGTTALFAPQDLVGKKVLVTAGPTEEPLDPVRFLSNRSSGKMGYALAQAAQARGASVTLISGPTSLTAPAGVNLVSVRTAQEMGAAVLAVYGQQDLVIKCAAVSDFRPRQQAAQKLKKAQSSLQLALEANDDILARLGREKGDQVLVGFAAESENHLAEGLRKCRDKNLDMIVVNDISGSDRGFAVDSNAATLIGADGRQHELPLQAKEEMAMAILEQVALLGDTDEL